LCNEWCYYIKQLKCTRRWVGYNNYLDNWPDRVCKYRKKTVSFLAHSQAIVYVTNTIGYCNPRPVRSVAVRAAPFQSVNTLLMFARWLQQQQPAAALWCCFTHLSRTNERSKHPRGGSHSHVAAEDATEFVLSGSDTHPAHSSANTESSPVSDTFRINTAYNWGQIICAAGRKCLKPVTIQCLPPPAGTW